MANQRIPDEKIYLPGFICVTVLRYGNVTLSPFNNGNEENAEELMGIGGVLSLSNM